jgi:hypothetical protein
MHEMSNGPQRPDEPLDISALTDATKPSVACLTPQEQAELAAAVHTVLHTIKGPGILFELAMDEFVKQGAHKVGHGLQCMVWSAAQSMMVIRGIKGRDMAETMVVITPKGDATEADVIMCDMAVEFVKATLAGAHQAAMEAWAEWVNSLDEDDWDQYTDGISLLLRQAIDIATGELEPSEMGSAILGIDAVQLVPRKPQED